MVKQTTTDRESSNIIWNNLEEMVRLRVRDFIQTLLEAEVEDLLGRHKSERRQIADSSKAYRNGYGKERNLTLGCGTIRVRRPRVRGLEGRFESQVLPLFSRRTKEVNQLLPELYLHGLALGDFDLALRGLLGKDAPISAGTVARLKEKWLAELEEWRQRRLDGLEVVYMWVDGVYVKAGFEEAVGVVEFVAGGDHCAVVGFVDGGGAAGELAVLGWLGDQVEVEFAVGFDCLGGVVAFEFFGVHRAGDRVAEPAGGPVGRVECVGVEFVVEDRVPAAGVTDRP